MVHQEGKLEKREEKNQTKASYEQKYIIYIYNYYKYEYCNHYKYEYIW